MLVSQRDLPHRLRDLVLVEGPRRPRLQARLPPTVGQSDHRPGLPASWPTVEPPDCLFQLTGSQHPAERRIGDSQGIDGRQHAGAVQHRAHRGGDPKAGGQLDDITIGQGVDPDLDPVPVPGWPAVGHQHRLAPAAERGGKAPEPSAVTVTDHHLPSRGDQRGAEGDRGVQVGAGLAGVGEQDSAADSAPPSGRQPPLTFRGATAERPETPLKRWPRGR